MRDLKKATNLDLYIYGTPNDIYFMQHVLGELLIYMQNTNKKLNYSLIARDKEGAYEALGTDDTEFILQIVESIVSTKRKTEDPWGGKNE